MHASSLTIRTASASDLDAIAALEAVCFPAAEAASRASLAGRLTVYAGHFWLLEENGRLVSYIGGPVTKTDQLTDDLYDDPACHDESAPWQMIFSVVTHPDHRGQGCAAQLMRRVIADCRSAGRAGLILTCKDALRPFYAQFGFRDEGVSTSVHGGAVWYQMRLRLSEQA